MRAVVMEINSRYTIALTQQGEYIRLKTLPHYKVGCEVEYKSPSVIKHWVKYASVAAVLIFCISMSGFIYAYTTPYSYINLDTDPGVEISVNRFDYIIGAKGVNADGDALLARQSVLHKPLRDGVGILLEQLNQEGYLETENQSTLLFTIASEDEKKIDRFDKTIGEAVERKLSEQSQVEVYVIHTDLQTQTKAKKYNLSSGRFLLIQELLEASNQNLNPIDMQDVPIGQIIKMVRKRNQELKDDEKSTIKQGLLKEILRQREESEEEQQEQRKDQKEQEKQEKQQEKLEKQQEKQEKQESQEKRQNQGQGNNQRKQESQGGRQKQEQGTTKPSIGEKIRQL
ncbi:MAG TPA: anti-sigma factor domain-containing protein [Clostridiaceae bacterium]|nr:anti-sigma factor domain-containing protein [Clostridiaceae bacterium]